MAITVTRLEELDRPTHAEWGSLGEQIDASLLQTLRSLTEEEWSTPTECQPWTVKDAIAHLIGWEEATLSPASLIRQSTRGWKDRKAHGGNWLDATNQNQVDTKASASPAEITALFAEMSPRYHKVRRRYGSFTPMLPFKEPFSGTWVPLRFLFDTIYVRDHFMHHIDICTALGREVPVGDAERRVTHDAFREWSEKAGASVTLELSGPAGGTFVRGSGETLITGDAIDLCRVIAGRRCDTLEIEGDRPAAERWLRIKAAF
jgi:uncharacterized protein (TIGR03083 family)